MPPHLRCGPGEGWSGPCTARHTSKETWEGTKDRGPSPNQRHLRARMHVRAHAHAHPRVGPTQGIGCTRISHTRHHGPLLWGGLCATMKPLFHFPRGLAPSHLPIVVHAHVCFQDVPFSLPTWDSGANPCPPPGASCPACPF